MENNKFNFQATAEASNLIAIAEAKKNYIQNMNEECSETKSSMSTQNFKKTHERHAENAFEYFNDYKKMGDKKLCENYLRILKNVCIF